MSNYRGLLWSLVAIAGTATAATIVYRYATRNVRPQEDEERHGRDDEMQRTAERLSANDDEEEEEVDYEYESYSEGEGEDDATSLGAQAEQQQLTLLTRERNMMLLLFGLVLMIMVGAVSLVLTWTSGDENMTPIELPMFPPLMWIAIGVVTAASVEMMSHPTNSAAAIEVLPEKTVFPHDENDFELIRQYSENAQSVSAKAAKKQSDGHSGQNSKQNGRANERLTETISNADDEEEKPEAPSEISAIINNAEKLFVENRHTETREYLRKEISNHPKNVDLLWRLARACNFVVEEKNSAEEKKLIANEGLLYAEQAYALNPDFAASNKWMAIMTSTVGNFRDLKEKIAGAYVIRDHIQRAIELDPSDATSHNILGQWCLAFADMTWIEKRAASALFGTPPTATYEDAVKHFHAAENISPGFWKKNSFLLAQTYMKMKKPAEAAKWVVESNKVLVKTKEDEEVQEEIMALMKKLKL